MKRFKEETPEYKFKAHPVPDFVSIHQNQIGVRREMKLSLKQPTVPVEVKFKTDERLEKRHFTSQMSNESKENNQFKANPLPDYT